MRLQGEVIVPGDKSITHRGILLSSIARGTSRLIRVLKSEDTLSTLSIMEALGVFYEWQGDDLFIEGTNNRFTPPKKVLDCGNSGTTARLLLGLLSGRDFSSEITGDDSLKRRPMGRVVHPLQDLGAKITLTDVDYLPAIVHPSTIYSHSIELTIASAQVKSALILASLNQEETVKIREYGESRDHTERMIQYFGGDLTKHGKDIYVSGRVPLTGKTIVIPGDFSSAALFIIAALIIPGSDVMIRGVGLNPTRTGLLDVLKQTGANIEIQNIEEKSGEPVGDIRIRYTHPLKQFTVDHKLVPRVIDEIPILALLATQIDGISIITGAEELRVKETDRLRATYNELTKLGARIFERPDGLTIEGKSLLIPARVSTYHDHRMSMMLKVAELLSGPLTFDDRSIDRISYPNFSHDLKSLIV